MTTGPLNAHISTPFSQWFSLKYVLAAPLKNFGGIYKIRNICDTEVQFTILTVQGP
jgi:hypothetical protein